MTSIRSISSPLSLSAIRSPQSNAGLTPVSWKIRPSVEANALSTPDSFVRQSPIIRSLDPQKLPRTEVSFEIELSAQAEKTAQEPQLSRTYLFQALDQALKNLPAGVDLKQIHPLAEAAKNIRVENPLPVIAETRLPKRLEQALSHPRSEALRDRLSQRIETSLARLEQRLEDSNSPRLQQMHRILSAGLERLQAAATGEKTLAPAEQQEATMAMAMSQCIGHLHENASPAEQATRLQQWVLLLEERRQETGGLTPQDLLNAAAQIQSSGTDQLQTGMQSALQLLAGPGQTPSPNLMEAPLAASGLEALNLMQDMRPEELSGLGAAMSALRTDLRNQWAPAFADLNSEVGIRIAEAADLSGEAEDLIRRADELALRVLSPKPEPPKGFEDGLVSLIRAFREIFEQLDKDQGAILLGNLSRILERRKGDSVFFAKLQTDQQFELNSRSQRENLSEQVQERYDRLVAQLQNSLAA
ncbi:MAG: hypothetical protein AB7I41_09505 [Candidatus Sericytochromatia bacterium]